MPHKALNISTAYRQLLDSVPELTRHADVTHTAVVIQSHSYDSKRMWEESYSGGVIPRLVNSSMVAVVNI